MLTNLFSFGDHLMIVFFSPLFTVLLLLRKSELFLPWVTLVFCNSKLTNALASVPDPPSRATLDVVGSDSLEVSFAPPLSDGGSPITSYTVSQQLSTI
jgi:hypothetical protein